MLHSVQVKSTVEQIQRLRSNKINAGLQLLVGPITVKLNNLSAMEVNIIRPFFQGSLDRFDSLSKVRAPSATRAARAAQSPAPLQLSGINESTIQNGARL